MISVLLAVVLARRRVPFRAPIPITPHALHAFFSAAAPGPQLLGGVAGSPVGESCVYFSPCRQNREASFKYPHLCLFATN